MLSVNQTRNRNETFTNVRRNKQMGDKMEEFKHPSVDGPFVFLLFLPRVWEMQTVYRQSFKKFYMQTGASESAFVWQLREERKEVSHWKAKNILLKTSRHYGNNDYTIIHARLDQLFFSPPPSSLIVEYIYIYISQTHSLKDTSLPEKKKIYIYICILQHRF